MKKSSADDELRSLEERSMAMEARKPIFHLKASDGVIGANTHSVKDCEMDFHSLAEAIREKLQPITPA